LCDCTSHSCCFLAWIFASSYASSGGTAAWNTLLFVVLLFLCVLLHEFGTSSPPGPLACRRPYVTLLPIGGIAQLERIPEEPWEGFLIALAGPAVNVVIAGVLIAFAHAHPRATAAIGVDDMQIPMADRLAAVNLPACAAAASKARQIARPISTADRSASLASRPCSMLTSRRTKLLVKMKEGPRPPYPARPGDGWHFSRDGVRFLQGERPRCGARRA
jgi:hypothetical protein